MRRQSTLATLVLVTVVVSMTVASASTPGAQSPDRGTARAAVGGGGETLVFNFRGLAQREASAPDVFRYTTNLYTIRSGEKAGTATHVVRFTEKPLVFEHTIMFHLPDGDLVAHQLESYAPDGQVPGSYLIGIHPDTDTVDPARSTGAYAGRTGRVRMAGWHNSIRFPAEVHFDDFWVVELRPTA